MKKVHRGGTVSKSPFHHALRSLTTHGPDTRDACRHPHDLRRLRPRCPAGLAATRTHTLTRVTDARTWTDRQARMPGAPGLPGAHSLHASINNAQGDRSQQGRAVIPRSEVVSHHAHDIGLPHKCIRSTGSSLHLVILYNCRWIARCAKVHCAPHARLQQGCDLKALEPTQKGGQAHDR